MTLASIFKKGRKDDPGHFRPVSFTVVSGKFIKQFLLEVNLGNTEEKDIGNSQCGFT